jgi:hypothetical protein
MLNRELIRSDAGRDRLNKTREVLERTHALVARKK